MDYLRLLAALMLPWLGGYLWLAAIEKRFSTEKPNTLRQVGYGLFIGYAAVQAITLASNALFDSVSFWPLLTALAILFALGGVAFVKLADRSSREPVRPCEQLLAPRVSRAIFWIFLGWACLHMLLVAVEIVHRPVFPWDAWLNWSYRAKAWFYSGTIFPLDLPEDWVRGNLHALYNVSGNHYPTFAPVMSLWAATALGYWSETLVNLPVLFCGIGLALGLYGQCRELGMPAWLSMLSAYLLLSIPLVGTHLSLAGQADIWMAGFNGLGFVALMHGMISGRHFQILLGLAMVAVGMAVKLEGTVWFLAALLTFSIAKKPGFTVKCFALIAVLCAVCWLTGTTYIEIPLLGGAGLAEGRLHIPLLGSYQLTSFDLWDDYRENFFQNGTWHLLWTFTLLGLIGLRFVPAGMPRRTILAFYTVLLAAQLFIFEGTESGKWADDWTAINRLPLHFVPPLVFSFALVLVNLLSQKGKGRTPGSSLRSAVASFGIVTAITIGYLMIAYPGSGGSPTRFAADELSVVVGGGRLADDVGLIDSFQDNIAILSSGPVMLDTKAAGLLQLKVDGENQALYKFFWRTGKAPEDLHSIAITERGSRLINLSTHPQWRGTVSELGMIFYADGEKAVEFGGLEIQAGSLTWQLRKLAQDWSETTLWSQRSAHWLTAGAADSSVSLPLVMAAWVLGTLLMAGLFYKERSGIIGVVLVAAMSAWVILDLRWTANSIAQAVNTTRAYPLFTANYLEFGDDKYTWSLVQEARSHIESGGGRTILMAEDDSMRFQLLRAKYHALPASVLVFEGAADNIPAEIADHLLLMKKRYSQPGQSRPLADDYAGIIARKDPLSPKVIWDKPGGFLLSIGNDDDSANAEK